MFYFRFPSCSHLTECTTSLLLKACRKAMGQRFSDLLAQLQKRGLVGDGKEPCAEDTSPNFFRSLQKEFFFFFFFLTFVCFLLCPFARLPLHRCTLFVVNKVTPCFVSVLIRHHAMRRFREICQRSERRYDLRVDVTSEPFRDVLQTLFPVHHRHLDAESSTQIPPIPQIEGQSQSQSQSQSHDGEVSERRLRPSKLGRVIARVLGSEFRLLYMGVVWSQSGSAGPCDRSEVKCWLNFRSSLTTTNLNRLD